VGVFAVELRCEGFGVAAPLVPGVFVAVCTLDSELEFEFEDEEPDPERSERITRRNRSLKGILGSCWVFRRVQVF
jgi:hypothetical protein